MFKFVTRPHPPPPSTNLKEKQMLFVFINLDVNSWFYTQSSILIRYGWILSNDLDFLKPNFFNKKNNFGPVKKCFPKRELQMRKLFHRQYLYFKGSLQWEPGGARKVAYIRYRSQTVAIDVCMPFNLLSSLILRLSVWIATWKGCPKSFRPSWRNYAPWRPQVIFLYEQKNYPCLELWRPYHKFLLN